MSGITLRELHAEVIALLDDVEEGDALDAGATPAMLQEVLVLVSGIGMHTLIGTAGLLTRAVRRRDGTVLDGALDDESVRLAELLLEGQGREARIADVAPEFWPNLLRLSPLETARAVADFRAAPWAVDGSLTTLQRELIGVCVDSMPTHRFLPTLRIHVRQAALAGAGRRVLQQVLDLAATTTLQPGVR